MSTDVTQLVFVYGTLLSGMHNNRFMQGSTLIGTGTTVEEYTMYAEGIPFVSKKEPGDVSAPVVGEVYEVPTQGMRALDRLEGHPDFYKREQVSVSVGAVVKPCWVYFCDARYGNVVEDCDYRAYMKRRTRTFV